MLENQLLAEALRGAGEAELTALANKGLYKRAVKDAENAALDFTELDGTALVIVGGEKCVITQPLSASKCSCPSRTICRHILTAILLLQKTLPEKPQSEGVQPPDTPTVTEPTAPGTSLPEKSPEPSEAPQALSAAECEKIHACAEMCRELICGVLSHGLVRVSESAAEDFELAAVRCHAAKMAECERLMRGLGGRIADCAARRASFDSRIFTDRLLETADCLDTLSDDLTPDALGSFRGKYEPIEGSLDIIPVGQRTMTGGGHEGDIFYFVTADRNAERRFLTFSDLRPTYYENVRRRQPAAAPWGLGAPLKNMMKQRMTLSGAKVRGGRLSASKDTVVTALSGAVLDSPLIHSMMVTDLREIIVTLAERASDDETDRLFFIYPKRLADYGFDRHTQRLIMTFEDDRGCTAKCVVKYRAETKGFIELLERRCARMKEARSRTFSLLVSAYIDEGELRLFPIEVYDFIMPIELHGFELPQKYDLTEYDADSAEELLCHISRTREMMTGIVRTGLQAEIKCNDLITECGKLGMSGLAELTKELVSAAESCRHSMKDNSRDVLRPMQRLKMYLDLAEKKLEITSALAKLQANNGNNI